MAYSKAELSNTLENWLDNVDLAEDNVYMVECAPFDELYTENNISVTAMHQDNKLFIAVGCDGAAEVYWEGPKDGDYKEAGDTIADAVINQLNIEE